MPGKRKWVEPNWLPGGKSQKKGVSRGGQLRLRGKGRVRRGAFKKIIGGGGTASAIELAEKPLVTGKRSKEMVLKPAAST